MRRADVSAVQEPRRQALHEPVHEAPAEAAAAPWSRRPHSDVIFVVNHLQLGGSEIKIVQIANALAERGMRVGVAWLNEPLELAGRLAAGIPLWPLSRRGKFSPQAVRALRALIRAQQPVALLAVNLYPSLYVAAATRGMSPHPRTVGLINTTSFPKRQQWRRFFYRWVLARLDHTVYGCESQRRWWRSKHPRSQVIYNGVNLDRYQPQADAMQAGAPAAGIQGSFVVGCTARLAPEKNQSVLIDAVAALRRSGREVQLLLVGEGRMRTALERQAQACGIERWVRFAGALPDVRPALGLMDVFVLPSLYIETFSNAALEAMAMRKPVILSRVGGAEEMIRDGVEGYIVDPGRLSTDLPQLIGRLYDDAMLRAQLGTAARLRVEREFSMNTMVDAYQRLIGPYATRGRQHGQD